MINRINVQLSAYEGDAFPNADDLYQAWVQARLEKLYPGVKIDVVTMLGQTHVWAYPSAGPADYDVSNELTSLCKADWWEEFCDSFRTESAWLAGELITRSISHNEIVHADHVEDLARAFRVVADDSVDTERCLEFWGTRDGKEWRVHLDRG